MKKIQFFSMVQKGREKMVMRQDGYTDGEYNYYRQAEYGVWHCIDPKSGYSIASGRTRAEAEKNAKARAEKFENFKEQNKEAYEKIVAQFEELRSEAKFGGITIA